MTTINQANQHLQRGELPQAERLYRQLLKHNARDVNALWGLGKVALRYDEYQAAFQIIKQCVRLYDKEPRLWLSLAEVNQKLKRFDDVAANLNQALALNKHFVPTLLALAVYNSELGLYQKSQHYLQRVLAEESLNVSAFSLAVRINVIDSNDPLVERMWQYLNSNKSELSSVSEQTKPLSPQHEITLRYAFFTLFDRQQKHQQAFAQLSLANRLQFAQSHFSVADMQPFFSSLIDTFSEPMLNNWAQTVAATQPSAMTKIVSDRANSEDHIKDDGSPQAIFIVGMPRSGSTLLEQMLLGHPAIGSAGEVPFFAGGIAQRIAQMTGKHFPEGCPLLSIEQGAKLASYYYENVKAMVPSKTYIIDKMPANFQSIGLIRMLMPNAKIIHIKRDPIDVCWSIFKNYFAEPEPYFCSLSEIVDYYKNYQQVMKHWDEIIPDAIHTIDYADLVRAPEQSLTSLFAFCGLEYHPACLDFAASQRHIATLSDTQLRTGITAVQTKNWAPYKAELAMLLSSF